MDSTTLASVAGVILSLAFSYVPGLAAWYGALESQGKSLVMLGALLAVALGIFGLSCAAVIDMVACSTVGAISLVKLFVAAAIANQATYLLTPSAKG